MNLNSILIGSEDPKALADYYTKLLGAPMFEGDGYSSWQIGSGALSVGPHDQVKGRNGEPGRVIWNIESGDVQGDFDRFKAAGATVITAPYNPGVAPKALIATFADPDGNYFQLISPFEM